jgi:hypothetical protein
MLSKLPKAEVAELHALADELSAKSGLPFRIEYDPAEPHFLKVTYKKTAADIIDKHRDLALSAYHDLNTLKAALRKL